MKSHHKYAIVISRYALKNRFKASADNITDNPKP